MITEFLNELSWRIGGSMKHEVQGLGGGLTCRRIKCSKYLNFGQHILRLRHINGAKLEGNKERGQSSAFKIGARVRLNVRTLNLGIGDPI